MNGIASGRSVILRESAISAMINGLISIGFFLLVFGGLDVIPVWGMGNYAFDFLPQSFAVGLMASLVPALQMRGAIIKGKRVARNGEIPVVSALVSRALVNALAALIIGAGLAAALLAVVGIDQIASISAFEIKVAYGTVLGGIVTYAMIGEMLR